LRSIEACRKVIEAGTTQAGTIIRPSLYLLTFILIFFASACVFEAVEQPEGQGITPIVPATRAPSTPTAQAAPPTASATSEATPSSTPATAVSCDSTSGGGSAVPTASSSRSTTPEAIPTPAVSYDRLVAPRNVPVPEAPQPMLTRTDLVLENQVRLLLGADIDGYAVVALDLNTGRSVSINPASVFYSASVFKVWVMYEVLYQESLGLLDLNDELVMTPYYDSFGLGPRATTLCEHLTVLEAMEAMMSISDNAAAVLLQDLVGAPNINDTLAAIGLTGSALTPEDITLTAQDMALLLQFIGSGKLIDRQSSEVMASLMQLETFDNGLDAGVPAEATVAHKTGNWPTARHDVGIVFSPKSTYVIVILSDNRSGSYDMTKAISSLIYEAFNK
jgi:beta-lactamase class A